MVYHTSHLVRKTRFPVLLQSWLELGWNQVFLHWSQYLSFKGRLRSIHRKTTHLLTDPTPFERTTLPAHTLERTKTGHGRHDRQEIINTGDYYPRKNNCSKPVRRNSGCKLKTTTYSQTVWARYSPIKLWELLHYTFALASEWPIREIRHSFNNTRTHGHRQRCVFNQNVIAR